MTGLRERTAMMLLRCRHHGNLVDADSAAPEMCSQLQGLGAELARHAEGLAGREPDHQRLLAVLRFGIADLERLLAAGCTGPVRSLGYALHNIPDLLAGQEPFARDLFRFNFRVAACHWHSLGPALQSALCELVGVTLDVARRLLQRDGFAVNIDAGEP